MITDIMKKWLENHKDPEEESNHYKRQELKVHDYVYYARIQKRIDKEMDMLLWLAVHYPTVLTKNDLNHQRLKKLLLTLKAVNPRMEVELVLKNLEFDKDAI